MKSKIYIPFFILFALSSSLFGQDFIYKKDRTKVKCKVLEIGTEVVKFRELDMQDGPIVALSVDAISKLILENGREIIFKDEINNPIYYTDNKKKAIKFHFLSPIMEHCSFSFEYSIKPGRSLESDLGIIGFGFNNWEGRKNSGVTFGTGLKFMKTPDFNSRRAKYSHILKGSYFKPQVIFSLYKSEDEKIIYSSGTSSNITNDENIFAGAFLINIGRQVIYDNIFLIDFSFGIGYGFSSQSSDNNDGTVYRNYHFGYTVGIEDASPPVALSLKLKIGFLL